MNHKTFAQGMALLDEAFEHRLNETQAEIYWRVLGGLTDEEFEAAVWRHIRGSKFFPRPAELLAQDADTGALQSFNRLIQAAERGEIPVLTEGERLAVEALGGWERFGLTPYYELLRSFKVFKAFVESGNQRANLRLIERGGHGQD